MACRVDHRCAETSVIFNVFLAKQQLGGFLGQLNAAAHCNHVNIIGLALQKQVTDIAAHDVGIESQLTRRGCDYLEKLIIYLVLQIHLVVTVISSFSAS